ncbi:MAG: hypothetical protein AB8C46_18080, partial [Burkholderiaceae bacterium]
MFLLITITLEQEFTGSLQQPLQQKEAAEQDYLPGDLFMTTYCCSLNLSLGVTNVHRLLVQCTSL